MFDVAGQQQAAPQGLIVVHLLHDLSSYVGPTARENAKDILDPEGYMTYRHR